MKPRKILKVEELEIIFRLVFVEHGYLEHTKTACEEVSHSGMWYT